jgi:hypothetical protein
MPLRFARESSPWRVGIGRLLTWLDVTLLRVRSVPWPVTRDDPPSGEGGSSRA